MLIQSIKLTIMPRIKKKPILFVINEVNSNKIVVIEVKNIDKLTDFLIPYLIGNDIFPIALSELISLISKIISLLNIKKKVLNDKYKMIQENEPTDIPIIRTKELIVAVIILAKIPYLLFILE